MELIPISFLVELELGAVLLSAIGASFAWMQNKQETLRNTQRERHQRELLALRERHHRERLEALTAREKIAGAGAGEGDQAVRDFLLTIETEE